MRKAKIISAVVMSGLLSIATAHASSIKIGFNVPLTGFALPMEPQHLTVQSLLSSKQMQLEVLMVRISYWLYMTIKHLPKKQYRLRKS